MSEIIEALDAQKRITGLEKDVELINKTSGNHVSEINRRLESMQENKIASDKELLKKVEDTIKIAFYENNEKVDQKIKDYHEDKIKPILYGQNGEMGLIKQVENNSEEIKFAKKQGYTFATILTTAATWLGYKI